MSAATSRIIFPGATAGAEAARALEALVHEAVSTATARQALWLRLSTLPRALAQPHHLRLAVEALAPLTAADRARLFVLPNDDAVIVWRGPATEALSEARARLRILFADGEAAAPVARHLGLPDEAEVLLAAAAASRLPPPPARPPAPRTPLDPGELAGLEAALDGADLSRFARRRAVCVPAGHALTLAWEMRLFCLEELAETLAPGRDLAAAPWLFRRLTRALDLRMMALLAASGELHAAGPFGLALNIASLLSPAFLHFDAALPARLRGQVVIALRPEDVLADPPAFLFARGFAHARFYRLMLGGITQSTAGAFPPAATGIDHLELAWTPDLGRTTLAALGLPGANTVLDCVDSVIALDWAREQGVAYVSGTLVRAIR